MKYFNISELCKSETAKSKKINNTPSPEIVDNLEVLVNECLDPIREIFGKPICINSGYRCEKLNKVIGGTKSSHHLKGQAADITSEDNKLLFNIIKESDIPYTQLIWENGGKWIHISYDPNNLKKQILYINQ